MMHDFPRTFSLPESRRERVATPTFNPLRPHEYLRLRREAAGLTVQQVAQKMTRNPRELATAIDLVELLEIPGNTARRHETLDRLQAAFPFDPAVYRQLKDEPAERHPRVCRGCGASAWDHGDGPFAWATDQACIRCAGEDGAE